ncbi:hypothetical protein HPP92_003759 [Vanilla planifolia]|uniref:rRNA biogenesis protein RRP36 n=1 Tax=Vanilla planifolia TaxID=51239 RepID=A0A835S843_VANPL|nr:hypothetical protein HPP92_003759 [Vanilla planifolia]
MEIEKFKRSTVPIKDRNITYLEKEEIASLQDQEELELERELADIPFEELLKAKANGSHAVHLKPAHKQQKHARANKNRPMEMSSKVRIGRYREVIQTPKRVGRDPRFESLCGKLDTMGFRKRYSFLYEVELPAEKEKLHEMMKASKDPKTIKELKDHISWIDKELKSASRKNIESDVLLEHMKKEREAAKQGKHPFYLKKSEIRERKLIKKYNELKAAGKLDSFIEKRRKKNASKDHRYLPYRRPTAGGQN